MSRASEWLTTSAECITAKRRQSELPPPHAEIVEASPKLESDPEGEAESEGERDGRQQAPRPA
jgi:hypothetical protein